MFKIEKNQKDSADIWCWKNELENTKFTIFDTSMDTFCKRYEDDFRGHFWLVVKVILYFECPAQNSDIELTLVQG